MKVGHKLLNRYMIERLIGEGATATVYQARDLRLGRTVAIKVLLPYVQATARARFLREARSAAALNHPNIMAIYDEAEEDERHFLVVEYVDGQPLANFIPSPPETVAELGSQLCSALDYAHRMNIIHRDIKPANVYVTREGLIKLMDFGLAMERDAKHITAHGSIIGTPAYLSPEQARGKKLDHRTDIYSLGVVLYEMCTGRLPFDSNDISALLLQKVSQDPIPPQELLSSVPDWLNEAIVKAIQRDPEQRFQTAMEFAVALGHTGSTGLTLDTHQAAILPDSRLTEEAAPSFSPERPITVIVADDHAILRTSIAFLLDDQPDITVIAEAGTGDEALTYCLENPPDVLLLDLNMPGRTGLDVLPEIRHVHPQTRVLVLTGRTEDAFIIRALQAGAHGYLLKTSSQEELLESVRKVAQGNMILGTGVAERVVTGLLSPRRAEQLTAEERQVLLCIVSGHETNDAIAAQTGYTEQQVVDYLKSAIDKLNANSRHQAALMALRAGWITVDEAHQRN